MKKKHSSLCVILLAAGKGTRMKNPNLPKPLTLADGLSLIEHLLTALQNAFNGTFSEPILTCIVVQGQKIEQAINPQQFPALKIVYIQQIEANGTGGAVQAVLESSIGKTLPASTSVLIAPADLATLTPDLIRSLMANPYDYQLVGYETQRPFGLGRLLFTTKNQVTSIVEQKEATEKQLKIKWVNSSVYLLKFAGLKKLIPKIKPSKKTNEKYLTDFVKLAHQQGLKLHLFSGEESELLGVNTPYELTTVQQLLTNRRLMELCNQGVHLLQPQTTWIDRKALIAPGVVLEGHTQILGETKIESGSRIGPFCYIEDALIGTNCQIKAFSHLEQCHIRTNATIGPYARLRPKTMIEKDAKVGNFVEIKNATLGAGSKINHLSYLGDATVGENSNLGCGFITCNYDGFEKHSTVIGSDVFVGSSCQAIAPIEIHDNAIIGAGTTLTKDVPSGSLALSRTPQSNHLDVAQKIRAKKKETQKNKK